MSPVNPRDGKLHGFGRAATACWLSVLVPADEPREEEIIFVRLTEWQQDYLFRKLGTHLAATDTRSYRLLRCERVDEPGHDCCREECFKNDPPHRSEGNE